MGVEGCDDFHNPCLQVFIKGTQFLEAALAVEQDAGPALVENERLQVAGNEFQQLDVSLFPRRGLG